MANRDLPPMEEGDEFYVPLISLAMIDSMEYAGVIELDKASKHRRRVIESETMEEALTAVSELVIHLTEDDVEKLTAILGDEMEYLPDHLFDLRE